MWLSIGLRFWRQILILFLSLSFISFFFICAILGGIEDQSQQNGGCGGTVPSLLIGNTNVEQGWNFFTQQLKISNVGAAAILGNLMQESSVNPLSVQPDGPGRGIAQWTFDQRWQTLLKFSSTEGLDPLSLKAQLGFMLVEMNSGSYGHYDSNFNLMNITDAATYFEIKYENAGKPNMTRRLQYANQIYAQYGNAPITGSTNQTSQITTQCTNSGNPDGSTPPNVNGAELWYQSVMNVALKYKGMPYYWGGNAPVPGFDCSGLWQYSFGQIGINIPRTAQQQYDFTQRVSADQLKPGDFIFFSGTYQGPTITHVGIYVGNNYMYDSDNAGIGYHELNSYWQSHLAGYGRFKQ